MMNIHIFLPEAKIYYISFDALKRSRKTQCFIYNINIVVHSTLQLQNNTLKREFE